MKQRIYCYMTTDENALRNLACTFHIRNLVGKYRDINFNLGRGKVIPMVGFFWMDAEDFQVYGKFLDFTQGEHIQMGDYEFIVHPDSGHYDAWPGIVKKNLKWRHRHYEDIPRGRIIFYLSPQVEKCEFRVYMCPVLNSPVYKKLIMDKCSLPERYCRFLYDDEHYQLYNR